jgi:hypothetical protein
LNIQIYIYTHIQDLATPIGPVNYNHWIYDRSLLDFDPIVILRATSILRRQKEDKEIIYNITQVKMP